MFDLLYGFVWLISWIPLKILYLFSDFIYLIIYYIIPYRRKIVRENLLNSFPEKSLAEIIIIEKKFYRFFCDTFIETICLLHLSEKKMKKRFDTGDTSPIEQFYKEGKSVMIMTAHYGNWEWGSTFSLSLPKDKPVYNIYKRLTNKRSDRFMQQLRSRFGGGNIEMKELLRKMVEFKKAGQIASFAMISDQTPTRGNIHYWTTFLNQDTPVINGTEQLATKFNYPVIYIHINRIKRGYYQCEYHTISENPQTTAPFEITEKYIRILEEKIKEEPAYWLWTHKRWKYKRS